MVHKTEAGAELRRTEMQRYRLKIRSSAKRNDLGLKRMLAVDTPLAEDLFDVVVPPN
jgi:hypothetical protein